MDGQREWKTDPIPKFGDVTSLEERLKRHLPTMNPHRQSESTPEIVLRREADTQFRIKKIG